MVTVTECVAGSYVAVSIAWCCGARWFGQLAMSKLPCWYSAGAEVSGLPQLAGSSVLPSSATQSARMISASVPAPMQLGQAFWQQQWQICVGGSVLWSRMQSLSVLNSSRSIATRSSWYLW